MTGLSRQQRLFRFEADPSTLQRSYVPILLAKQGERIGLGYLDPVTRAAITPYMRVVPPELRHKGADPSPPAEISRLARTLGDQASYLDAAGTPRRDRRAPSLDATYVREIYEAAEACGMAFAPVYPYGRPDLADMISAFTSEALGAAVLLPADAALVWGGGRLSARLRGEVKSLGIKPHLLDLLVDLGYLAEGAEEASSAAWLVREALGAAPWRSVILAGTSVPDSVAREVPDGSLTGIERRERRLFTAVQAVIGTHLRFADYGVQHPVPPTSSPVPQMRASIRYTAGDFIFVSRGYRALGAIPPEERSTEYRDLAARIRDQPQFAQCCWADLFIDDLAEGRHIVRAQSSLRAVATCHHITAVTAERSVRSAATASPIRSGSTPPLATVPPR